MPDCTGTVPIVSRKLANDVIARLPRWELEGVLKASVAWLITQHPDLTEYNGVQGRQYSDEERRVAARDLGVVAALPCPFKTPLGCLLGGLGPGYTRVNETGRQPYAFLPMHIAKALAPETARQMVAAGEVADAKAVYLNTNEVGLIGLHAIQ